MSKPKEVEIEMTIKVDPQLLRDLLCTAVEGGSNYWANFITQTRSEHGDYESVRLVEDRSHATDKPPLDRIVTASQLAIGIGKLAEQAMTGKINGFDPGAAAKHFGDAITENGDAGTADVVLQMTVFGDLIYG